MKRSTAEHPSTERTSAAWKRLRRMNDISTVAVLLPVGVLLLLIDVHTWWHGLLLGLGVVAAIVATVHMPDGLPTRLAVICLAVTAVAWIFGVLVADSGSAFFSLTCVGPLIVSKLPRDRIPAGAVLTVFVTAVGALRLLVSDESAGRVLLQYVLIPGGVTVVVTALMFISQAFYDLFTELEEARDREADLAVVRERMRFASDLHDIQGHTLHVVKLKAALAGKLVRGDPQRAEDELGEIHTLVGDTISQTKELAYAQRRLNLSAELENAKNLFEAAGIEVKVDRHGEAHAGSAELFGQVLRETTTNILRHAQAGQVKITLSRTGIAIVNDGVPNEPLPELKGLSTLRERVADDGGELTVEQREGHFLTAAEFPRARTGATTRTMEGRS